MSPFFIRLGHFLVVEQRSPTVSLDITVPAENVGRMVYSK